MENEINRNLYKFIKNTIDNEDKLEEKRGKLNFGSSCFSYFSNGANEFNANKIPEKLK